MADQLEFYQDAREEWRWRRTASNGEIIGASSEGYKNRRNQRNRRDDEEQAEGPRRRTQPEHQYKRQDRIDPKACAYDAKRQRE